MKDLMRKSRKKSKTKKGQGKQRQEAYTQGHGTGGGKQGKREKIAPGHDDKDR